MKKKVIISVLAMALVLCLGIGGTLAWLQAKTEPLVNTFTYGDINITLTETTGTQYKMIPGGTITKDPKVTVKADSEASWLFVKIEKSSNFDSFMSFTVADGWTKLDSVDGVYYREVSTSTADQNFAVLKDNKISVPNTVTKEALKDASGLTLTFTAYAVQSDNVDTAAEAWAIANPS